MSKKITQKSKKQIDKPTASSFEMLYPYTARWLKGWGWIEIGDDGYSGCFIKVLDEGGLIWSSKKKYKDINAAFQALEKALATYMKKQLGE